MLERVDAIDYRRALFHQALQLDVEDAAAMLLAKLRWLYELQTYRPPHPTCMRFGSGPQPV